MKRTNTIWMVGLVALGSLLFTTTARAAVWALATTDSFPANTCISSDGYSVGLVPVSQGDSKWHYQLMLLDKPYGSLFQIRSDSLQEIEIMRQMIKDGDQATVCKKSDGTMSVSFGMMLLNGGKGIDLTTDYKHSEDTATGSTTSGSTTTSGSESTTTTSTTTATYNPGDKIMVEYSGSWYEGTVIEAATRGDRPYNIGFDGYEYSEWVEPSRVRPRD